jgi:hypothetical protein
MKGFIKLLKDWSVLDADPVRFKKLYNKFRVEFAFALKERGCKGVVFHKGHYYWSVFWTDAQGQIWYACTPDFRNFRFGDGYFGSMYYRTAESYKDYTGGVNQFVKFSEDMASNIKLTTPKRWTQNV